LTAHTPAISTPSNNQFNSDHFSNNYPRNREKGGGIKNNIFLKK